jgi:hypothetical protein
VSAVRRVAPSLRAVALSVALAGVALASPCFAQLTPRVQAARDAFEAGDHDRAVTELTEVARSENRREAASAVYFLAVIADEDLDFQRALDGYRDFVARDPSSRFAARALARIDDLNSHAEGAFEPLRRLETVRKDPALANDPTAIAALERAADGFPPGLVRAEARMLVGEAYLNRERLNRPRDAVRVFRALAMDSGAPSDTRSLAARRLIDAREVLGEEVAGEQDVQRLAVDTDVKHDAAVLARRSVLRKVSWAVAALTGVAGAFALTQAASKGLWPRIVRAWKRPVPIAQLALLTLGGGALARAYDEHEISPFVSLGAGALAVYLVASALSVVGSASPPQRAARAALCLLAVLAVSFLTMDSFDPMMLEGIYL